MEIIRADEVPEEIQNAALKVEGWMKSNGHLKWKLFGIQSREYDEIHDGTVVGNMALSRNEPENTFGPVGMDTIRLLHKLCGELFLICSDLYDSDDARIQEAAHSLEFLKQRLYP